MSAIFLCRQTDVLASKRSQEERTIICTTDILVDGYCSFLPTVINWWNVDAQNGGNLSAQIRFLSPSNVHHGLKSTISFPCSTCAVELARTLLFLCSCAQCRPHQFFPALGHSYLPCDRDFGICHTKDFLELIRLCQGLEKYSDSVILLVARTIVKE
jgi:hypothetical protein